MQSYMEQTQRNYCELVVGGFEALLMQHSLCAFPSSQAAPEGSLWSAV